MHIMLIYKYSPSKFLQKVNILLNQKYQNFMIAEHLQSKTDIISYYISPSVQHWNSVNKNKIAHIRDVVIFGLLHIHSLGNSFNAAKFGHKWYLIQGVTEIPPIF